MNVQVPRFATCTIANCDKPAVRGLSCAACRTHRCSKHQSRRYHQCPSASELSDEAWLKTVEDEVQELLSHVDKTELVRLASTLNRGRRCTFRPGKHIGEGAIMGCANYHAWIEFDDSEKWLVRIPRTGFSDVPADLVEHLVASEYATLKFLESTKIPAPKVFGFGLASDPANHVGVSYIFMEALPGKPYDPYVASVDQRRFVLGQVAEILIEISHHHFQNAGSLIFANGNFLVAELASNRFLTLGKSGPFNTAADYFTSMIDQHLDLIADGQLHHTYPKEAFLFYRLWGQHITQLCADESADTFFLKHVDDKGDHILVDEDYNIVGIIDWQFARTVPACEAFGPSLLTADTNNLYSRNVGITRDDQEISQSLENKGREDLSRYSRANELARRFHIGLASGLPREDVCEMIAGALKILDHDEDVESWISQESLKCRGDTRFAKIETLTQEQTRAG